MKKIREQEIIAYHASKEDIKSFDPNKTGREFGIHFGTLDSAKHRGAIGGTNYHIKKYSIVVKNPLHLDDVLRWDVPNIMRNMASKGYVTRQEASDFIKSVEVEAIKKSKENSSSLTAEKYKILKDVLEKMGYDSIVYDNKGETGGVAYIVFDAGQVKQLN
jgi:hypothetical protein